MKNIENQLSLRNLLTGHNSIDAYITYRCNLRCKHCFIGESLNLNTDFDFDLLVNLIQEASVAGLEEITFLGGEPTLYPDFEKILILVKDNNMNSRIVTNGGIGFSKLLSKIEPSLIPHTCFSIDGGTEKCHDNMRGRNSFSYLIENAKALKEKKGTLSVIASLDKNNAHEITEIINLSNSLGADYLNIHYVSSRGFAKENQVLSIKEWEQVVEKIYEASSNIEMPIRYEKTFIKNLDEDVGCLVKSNKNLMFFPDNKIYKCSIFLDVPNSHSYTYTKEGIKPNISNTCESKICNTNKKGCPATTLTFQPVLDELEKSGYIVGCVFNKTAISFGKDIIDLRPH